MYSNEENSQDLKTKINLLDHANLIAFKDKLQKHFPLFLQYLDQIQQKEEDGLKIRLGNITLNTISYSNHLKVINS